MKRITLIICILLILSYIFFFFKNRKKKPISELNNYLNATIYPNSIIIYEYNNYHFECLPGYIKYFTDLGFNVDVIIKKSGIKSLEYFEPMNKIRIFTYDHPNELKENKILFKKKFNMYNYSLLHTISFQKDRVKLFKNLGFYDNPNSLFVLHALDQLEMLGLEKYVQKNHVFGLADYGKLNYINPNYFGNLDFSHKKNKKIIFYVTSSINKYYSYLILAVRNLKNKAFDFEIDITGWNKNLNKKIIPQDIRQYFHFHGLVSYTKLYSIILKTDFIIMNLFPDNEIDIVFKTFRATGSAQLSYGFNRPVIVEESFAKVYKFSNQTAIIFKNHDLSDAMERAIQMSEKEYKDMTYNVKLLRESIYNISLNNLKKALHI